MTVIANTNERYITDDASSIYSLKKSVNKFMGDFAKLENQNKVSNGYFNSNVYGSTNPKYWNLFYTSVVYNKNTKSSSVTSDSTGFISQEMLGLLPNENYTAIITCTCPVSGALEFGVYGSEIDQIFNYNDDSQLNRATQIIDYSPTVLQKTIIQFKTNATTVKASNHVILTNISPYSINFTLEKIIVYKGLIEIDGISEIGAGISGNHNELDNLEGGGEGEFFHLTQSEYNKLNTLTSIPQVESIFYKHVLTEDITGTTSPEVGNTIDLSNYNNTGDFSFPIAIDSEDDGRFLQVYRNGQRLTPGEEYKLIPNPINSTKCNSIFVNTGQNWFVDDTILFSIPYAITSVSSIISVGQQVESIFYKHVLTEDITGTISPSAGNIIDLTSFNESGDFSFPILANSEDDGRFLQVYRNGQRLTPGEEYKLIPIQNDPIRCNSIFVNVGQNWFVDDTILFSIPSAVSSGVDGFVFEIPIGTITYFATSAAPEDYLVCDGSWKNKFTYSELYNVIGTNFGESGADFKLPDLRGEFIRGYDPTNIHDPDGSTRGFGSEQIDMFKEHNHQYEVGSPSGYTTGISTSNLAQAETATSNAGGLETRPHNVNLLPCIKASSKTLGVRIAGIPMQIATYTVSGDTTWNGSVNIPTTSGNTTFKYMTSTTLKGRYLEIYLNGVRLELDRDYTEDGSTNVNATESATVSFISLTLEDADHIVFKTGNQGPPGVSTVGVPVGTILEYSSNTLPEGFVFCNGTALSRTAYSDLYSLIGTTYGTTTVDNFKVPDTRGLFLRNSGGINDPDGIRALGNIQQDEFKAHSHTSPTNTPGGGSGGSGYQLPTYTSDSYDYVQGAPTSVAGGIIPETRPINMAINHIIKVLL